MQSLITRCRVCGNAIELHTQNKLRMCIEIVKLCNERRIEANRFENPLRVQGASYL